MSNGGGSARQDDEISNSREGRESPYTPCRR